MVGVTLDGDGDGSAHVPSFTGEIEPLNGGSPSDVQRPWNDMTPEQRREFEQDWWNAQYEDAYGGWRQRKPGGHEERVDVGLDPAILLEVEQERRTDRWLNRLHQEYIRNLESHDANVPPAPPDRA